MPVIMDTGDQCYLSNLPEPYHWSLSFDSHVPGVIVYHLYRAEEEVITHNFPAYPDARACDQLAFVYLRGLKLHRVLGAEYISG